MTGPLHNTQMRHILRDCSAIVLLAFLWRQNFTFGPSTAVVQSIVCWLCFSIFVMLCATIYPSREQQVSVILRAWLFAALVSACMGIAQYFGNTAWLQGTVTPATAGQAFGNLRQRNQFATLMSIGLIALLWYAHSARNTSHRITGFIYIGAAILATASAASGSRTGFLQWVMVVGMYWLWPTHKRSLLGFALASYALAAVALPVLQGSGLQSSGILSRLQDASPLCASRLTLWSNVWHLIIQKPLLGWGWGMLDYAHFVTLYPAERFCGIVDNAHNLPLHLAVELGLPIATLACTAVLVFVLFAKPWQEINPSPRAAWAVLAVIGLHSLLEYPLWYAPFQLAILLALYVLLSHRLASACLLQTSKGAALLAVSSLFILAGSCLVAYDYRRMSQAFLPPASRLHGGNDDSLTQAKSSWFFKDLANFAELTTMSVNKTNANEVFAMAQHLLRLSPEPRVIEKLIESATLRGHYAAASAYLARYKAAFPAESARWLTRFSTQPFQKADN